MGGKLNVYKKLQNARVKFHSKSLKKTGHNKFAGYYYFELGDFLPAIQEIFAEVGLIGLVSFTEDTATLSVIDVDQPEGRIEFKSPMGSAALKGCHEVQNVGAVETYQRRYLWVAAMEIVEHDVLDATTGKDEPKKEAKSAKMAAIDVTGWIDSIRKAVDAKKAKEIYQSAVKACAAIGDTEAAAAIKAALLEKWTPASATAK